MQGCCAVSVFVITLFAFFPFTIGPLQRDVAFAAEGPVPASYETKAKQSAPYESENSPLQITHPFDNAVLPANIAPVLFSWQPQKGDPGPWNLELRFQDGQRQKATVDSASWEPAPEQWALIRSTASESPVIVTVASVSTKATSKSHSFRFHRDEVHAPILYQQMPLPITKGLKHPELFKWLVADLESASAPRIVLENQKVCGMCHHVSADGSTFIMDLDVDKDKGAFAVVPVAEKLQMNRSQFHTWTGFQEDGKTTLGLFAKASPTGRHILATVQERNMFITLPDPMFSEVFFPIRGKLAYASPKFDYMSFLPGADDPDYAQTGGVFSPDGNTVAFSKAPVIKRYLEAMGNEPVLKGKAGESIDDYNRKYPIQFDIWTVPFNNGYGGEPAPLAGASSNGKSNYWPRYSPDGRFLVFTQAEYGMMNQPGSTLMVIPAKGGKARKLDCTLPGHNSWHSFSPDGKWLVFSSKVFGANTRLFLAHFDAQGRSAPPVFLHRLATGDMASVIPEFMNIAPGTFQRINITFDTLENAPAAENASADPSHEN